jgi:hypothetical protein
MIAMKPIMLILTVITATLLLSACCKVACSANDISLDFTNYRYEDVDTIYYLGYERGSNFRNLKDSNATVVPVNQRDTFRLRFSTILYINYDWVIKIPKQNKTFRFTDYEVGIDRCGCGNTKYEVLEAYTVNGVRQTNRFYTLPK